MLLITDSPDDVDALLGAAPRWSDRFPQSMALKSLWNELEQGRSAVAAEIELPEAAGKGCCPVLFVTGTASSSQYDRFLKVMRAGAELPSGLAAIALEGNGFHGNRGRTWAALRGNIHLCSVFPVNRTAEQLQAGLSMVPTVAAVDVLRPLLASGSAPGIKWVNDVEVEQKKICGTLTSTLTSGARVESVLYGIGLNVMTPPEVDPTPFVPEAACLADFVEISDDGFFPVLWNLLAALNRHLGLLLKDGADSLLESYQAYSSLLGEPVRVYDEQIGQSAVELADARPIGSGCVERFDTGLGLYLKGREHPVTRGRLARESACLEAGLPPC